MAQPRRMVVLRAIVEDYIRSQEPIGSAALTKKHDLGVSSATIRNDMASLEEEGYLIQPHTSSGRIQPEKGSSNYEARYFVDRLSTVVPLSDAQRKGIAAFLSGSVSLQDTLQRAARLLSHITGQVAVVASPSPAKAKVLRVQIVPVSSTLLLIVVITDAGNVAQHTLALSPQPTDITLADVGSVVNGACLGLTFAQAAERVRSLKSSRRESVALLEGLAQVFEAMGDNERSSELYMAGASHLAHRRDIADMAPLFDALEEQIVLMKLMSALSEDTDAYGVGVAIGSETHTPELLHASVVTSGYGNSPASRTEPAESDAGHEDGGGSALGGTAHANTAHTGMAGEPRITDDADAEPGKMDDGDSVAMPSLDGGSGESSGPVAFVGSIGPTHMDYAATIAAVRAVARYLTRAISSYDDGDGN